MLWALNRYLLMNQYMKKEGICKLQSVTRVRYNSADLYYTADEEYQSSFTKRC